jgi:uncharacterized protein YaeQ
LGKEINVCLKIKIKRFFFILCQSIKDASHFLYLSRYESTDSLSACMAYLPALHVCYTRHTFIVKTYARMALKSTIYKIDLNIADMDRHYYQQHNLTLAKHPSETDERLMVRLLAFVLYADEHLQFGNGLSDDDEPDLWQKDLTGAIQRWICVGLPEEREIRKACGRAEHVVQVLYGGRTADMWWAQNSKAILKLDNVTVINLPDTEQLAAAAARGLSISFSIQDEQILVSYEGGSFEIAALRLKDRG